jgi:glycosyltransferase involved in cell wall biosynthesis
MGTVRVLLVAPSTEIVGGQSIQAARLLEALSEVPNLQVTFQPVNPEFPSVCGRLRRVKYVRTAITEILYSRQLFAAVGAHDVIHVFTASYSSFLLTFAPLIAFASLLRKPVILNYHDGRAEDHLRRSLSARKLTQMSRRLVVPSRYLAEVFARFNRKALTIPNIVDSSQFPFRERTNVRPRFLHNRGLERHYNVECSLRAFAIVQERYPQASLDIAHDGPLRVPLQSLAAALQLKNVRFVGQITPSGMQTLYRDADIYIMSPDADNAPLSVLECFASGLPVISTAAGGVPYLIEAGKTGLLVPRGDYRALAAAALRLIDEDGLARAITSCARNECRKYEPDQVARQWCVLYREVSSLAAK